MVVALEAGRERLGVTFHVLAAQIGAGSPHSLGLIKSLVYNGLTAPVGEHMERHTTALAACFKSDDHREGVASFLERRPANFTGT